MKRALEATPTATTLAGEGQGPRRHRLWRQWRRLVHRAAVAQSNALLFLVYYLLILPLALLRRATSRSTLPGGAWRPMRQPPPGNLDSWRQQF
ncbi:MAG: hypothetical protein JJE40_14895 [Vicinamibacteria bacterium]|nr:hypothetical protein [Vicinamibacteria bacterium]